MVVYSHCGLVCHPVESCQKLDPESGLSNWDQCCLDPAQMMLEKIETRIPGISKRFPKDTVRKNGANLRVMRSVLVMSSIFRVSLHLSWILKN